MSIPAATLENPVECQVCLDDVTRDGRGDKAAVRGVAISWNEAVIASCTHLYHKNCLKPWLEDATHDPKCPTCRAGPFTHVEILHDGSREGFRQQWNRFSHNQYPDDDGGIFGINQYAGGDGDVFGEDLTMGLFCLSSAVSTFALNFIYVDFGLSLIAGLAIGIVFTAISLTCYEVCVIDQR